VCARYNGPLPAAALQFPLLHPQVTSVIPGAFAPSQVTDNLDHVRREISAALWQELQHDGLIRADVPISAA
jgi:D-threo-aldose 1-dehydrogenase